MITILSGQTTGSVTFTVVDDTSVESLETATLTISNPSSGITLGTPTSQNIAITDNDVAPNPTVSLSVSANAGSEAGATAITVTATADAAVTGDQTVSLGVAGTDITAGDYSLSNTTITIPSGLTTGSVTFTVTDDALVESLETAVLTISSPSAGITLGTPTSQNIAITDNDFPTVNLSVSSTTGTEAAQTVVTVTATASSAVTGNQTVSLAVTGTGITAGDYTLSNTTITIPNGLTTGTVTFTVVDDQLVEGAETATLTISNPSPGITLGTPVSRNVTITDNDIATTLVFDSTNATVLESVGIAKVFLRVTATGNVPGSVNLAASAYSTATGGGVDYTVPTLNIAANLAVGTLVSFDFTINDDATAEADEYVICKTTAASNIIIASTAQSTLYIKDNDTQTPVASNQLGLSFVSSFSNGASGTNSAEISAYDKGSKRLFIANSVANRLDIVNFTNPAAPVLISSINLGVAPFNGAINSVEVFNGTVALALEGLTDKQANGKVVFTDINGTYISEAASGAMPDMITFNHAGTKVYTANEGEPNAAYTNDPVGSITVVDISGGVASPSATTIGFTAYNGQEIALRSQGIRIYGLNASAAQDFEPEYITISDDDTKAWVALQENNALVELDLTTNTIVKLIPLGYKDHSLTANAMDVSDQTSGINLSNFNVRGMYQPDAITQYTSGGNIYLLTANEGDSRNYTGFSEEVRMSALNLDPAVYPNSADIKNNAVLGRLTVTNRLGDIDNDGDIDQIYCLGGRSFSIWNPATSSQVYDSKDDLERITANSPAYSQFFNMSNTIANTAVKNRSDDKGPEPEGVTTGKIGNKTYAFVGLERIGGVMIYDVTNPVAPVFVTYANSRTTSGGDRGTEGIFFIPANESPNGKGLVVLSNEISSTVSTFEITPCAAPGIAAIANDGNTSICPGSTVRLYNVNNNNTYTYQWLKDGVEINGAVGSDYIATTSGAYSLVAFNAAGCVDTSAAITVTIVPAATVNLSVSTNTASETAGTVVTVTATASAAVCGAQTVSLGISGTGITASDYTLSNATITIPDGQTTGTVTFTVVNDNVVEALETAVVTISNPSSGIALGTTTTQNIAISDFAFTLQVLHASDFEGAVEAVQDAPRFAAIVDVLEDTYANTIKLSSGDNYIPGPFLSSGEDPSLSAALKTSYESYYNTTFSNSAVNLLPSIGRADISILNFIGIEASALGNHEFDLGTTEVRNIIRGANSSATVRSWFGAQFPYLSSNLNFSGDSNLSAIATTNRLLPNTSFMSNPTETVSAITNKLKLAPSTIIIKGGQKIGIVGATTQVLASISSPGATTVVGGGANDMNILAGIIQPVVNSLIADGCNKIILLSHLQQIAFEKELAGKLTGVDIIMAGGSNTLMADANDRLRAGDVASESYPFLTTGLDGKSLALINTDGNYKYVGRLVVDFDADGTLIPSSINPVISGVYAADAQGLNDAWGANVGNAFAVGTRGYQVQLLCNAIGNVITVKDGNLFGKTSVFLEGRRNFVRTEETNLGNITAEANLWLAKFYDPTTVISIKNGGGIRSAIGNVIAVGDNVTFAPPIANPSAGKQSGDISQLDIENSLRFNNQLSLMTLTASGLRSILEHAVRATTATATPGQFAQVAGVRYSYNFSLAAGSRILNAVITDASGNAIDNLVVNGTTVGDLSRTFRVVTLNFLAGGGDSYPFNTLGTNRSDLNTLTEQGPAMATFTNAGSEQDAFAEYMKNQFSTTPYAIAETALAQDCRIQRVPARADNVLPPSAGTNGTLVICNGTIVTESQLFAALSGTPVTGGTWSPVLAGAGVYTYTVTSVSCAGSATATVTVTEQALPNAGTSGTLSVPIGTTPTNAQLFAALTGTPNASGTWSNIGLVYTYTVAATFPCTVAAMATITVTEFIPSTMSFCQGARLASAVGTTSLKFYSAAIGGSALAATTTLTTRTLFATQTINGVESTPRVAVAITVNPLPSEVLGAITSNTVSTTAASGFAAANIAVGQFVGTTTAVSYRIPAFGGSGLTYLWKVPAGVTIVGQAANVTEVTQTGTNANILTVHYNNVAAGVGVVGVISVQAVNASGCAGTAKSITVSKVLPTAPSAIRMTNAALPLVNGLATAITSFARYMGTNTELMLTATPAATATSYVWELPTGVNVTNGSATNIAGVISSTSNVITVNFSGVTNTNTYNYLSTSQVSTNNLRIGVRSSNGVGLSITNNAALANSSATFLPNNTSSARLLTLTAIRPAAPSALRMFNTAVSATATVTDISRFIGTSTTLTLVATPSAFASSYSWELPSIVNFIGGDITSNTITVNFANVPVGTTAFYIGVKAVNGIGSSITNNSALTSPATTSDARLLKVTAKAPAVAGTVVGSLAICPTTASNVTYSIAIAAVGANSYNVTVPLGCTINGGATNTASIAATSGATFTVNYPAAFVANTTTAIRTITIQSVNGFGVSTTNKVLRLTNVGAVCTTSTVRKADRALSLIEFEAVAYPVPSFDVINIEIQSSSKEASQVQVYDMQGRLIDNFKSNETSFQLGRNYPSGVYNVIVSQGSNVKTVRVVKR